MATHNIKRGNSKLTVSINTEILNRYKQHCEKKGLITSKQIENFMLKKIKEAD